MAEIIWTKKARNDLKAIYDYISNDSAFYAERYVMKLIQRVDALGQFPASGRIVPEYEDPSVRELIEGNYRIFYKTGKSGMIYILRVHHAARMIQ